VQAASQNDQHLTQSGLAREVRRKFAIDLQRSPMTALPLTEAPCQLPPLPRPYGEQRTVACGSEFDFLIEVESEAVRAARMISAYFTTLSSCPQPVVLMESLRRASGNAVKKASPDAFCERSPARDDPDQATLAMEQGQATPPAAPTFKLSCSCQRCLIRG
jgi:hypothetical protein